MATLFLINPFSKAKLPMKTLLLVLITIVATTILSSSYALTPFGISGTGVSMESYQLDPEVNSIILEVQVSDSKGTLELTFDREFFDAIYQDSDDMFLVLGDGDMLSYTETKTTSLSRTIQINLIPDIEEVEIFGSHLIGRTVAEAGIISQIKEKNVELVNEKTLLSKQISDLSSNLEDVKAENVLLEDENEELEKKIFNPNNLMAKTKVQANNLMAETEVQANNLNSFIMKQINLITSWIKSFF